MAKPVWFYLSWFFQLLAAVLLLLTFWHKWYGTLGSEEIFTRLRLEPFGRWSAAVTEGVIAILILWPGMVWAGALAGLSLGMGAIFFHGAILGLEVGGDGGYNFYSALGVSISCLIVLYLRLFAAWPLAIPGPLFLQDKAIAQIIRRYWQIKKKR